MTAYKGYEDTKMYRGRYAGKLWTCAKIRMKGRTAADKKVRL